MINKTACFTGHREIPAKDYGQLKEKLSKIIRELALVHGCTDFVFGGAVGFDTLAAVVAEELRSTDELSHINIHLYLPCKDQTKGWAEEDVAEYERLKKIADSLRFISEYNGRGVMFKRNRAMVDASKYVISYCNYSTRGGTAYTTRYAYENDRIVIPVGKPFTREDFVK